MSRQERFEAPRQHMFKELPGDGEKRYQSVAVAIRFVVFAFIKWDDYPISPIRWNTNRQPYPVKGRM